MNARSDYHGGRLGVIRRKKKSIILGGGQNLLSPERRFDAIIYNSPELFE